MPPHHSSPASRGVRHLASRPRDTCGVGRARIRSSRSAPRGQQVHRCLRVGSDRMGARRAARSVGLAAATRAAGAAASRPGTPSAHIPIRGITVETSAGDGVARGRVPPKVGARMVASPPASELPRVEKSTRCLEVAGVSCGEGRPEIEADRGDLRISHADGTSGLAAMADKRRIGAAAAASNGSTRPPRSSSISPWIASSSRSLRFPAGSRAIPWRLRGGDRCGRDSGGVWAIFVRRPADSGGVA